MKFLSCVVVALILSGCSSSKDAHKALEAQGFTNIETHGRAFFSCSDDDTFATKFTATNAKGETVKGAVCSSWLKGSTIRYD